MIIEKMIVDSIVIHPIYGKGKVIMQGMGTVHVEFEDGDFVREFDEQENPLSFY